MAGFQTPTTSSSSGSESDVAEILPRATPGTRQNSSLLSTISHFPIIYTPSSTTTGSLSQTDAVALRCEDTHTLQNELTSGGVLVSVKSPHDAMSWIEAHQDHPLLQSLKSHNVAGPIAVRISPEESALAIFGSIADALVPEMARNLVAVSGFSVMVRSSVDNPIPAFVQHVSEGNDLSCEQPYSVSFGPVARLRGGADPAEDDCETWTTPKWEGKYHNATVDLKLRLGNEKVYDVTLDSYMKFKTQPLVNSNPTMFRPQPEVLSHVNLKVQLRRGETMLDRSFSNLGFVVHRPRAISTCDL
ncbi:hypothetical protein K438DRAFT_694907 [Mycena galopus ATCC 62051]|nr:hypothetical protein K438DRAFT_694907 [Mycena galopus ATCC 62051]